MKSGSTKRLPNVVYIAGAGRSGSTVLDRALGSIEGVASFNEMHVILTHDYMDRQLCSCGQERNHCAFWVTILSTLSEKYDLEELTNLSHKFDSSKIYPLMALGLMGRKTRRELNTYGAFLHDLYCALAEQAGVDTIVDSSKIPTRVLILKKNARLPVQTVHLVRDPRAVAASWMRKKKDPSIQNGEMMRYPLSRTLAVWAFRQISSELLRFWTPYLRVRYERFAEAPRHTVEMIRDFVPALSGRKSGFVSEFEVDLPPLHSLSGNPDRFEHGKTSIRIDEKWRTNGEGQLGIWQIMLWPIMFRYGYGD